MSEPKQAKKADVQPLLPVLPVLDVPYRDVGGLLNPEGGRRQPLHGFQDDYVDIVHYIIRCTHDIWEKGDVGLIYSHYSHNARVHSSEGMIYGRDQVVQNTLQNRATFPNLRAFADDVIWSGNETEGFYSSHRVYDVARHTGHSVYGPPTGRWVKHYTIADCLVLENRIVEEWLVYDNLAIIRQLGLDPFVYARSLAQRDADVGLGPRDTFGDVDHHPGQEPPPLEPDDSDNTEGDTEPEAFMRRSLHDIWNRRMLGGLEHYYAPNVVLYTTGHRILHGRADYRYNLTALLAAFPDAHLLVDHTASVPNGADGFRVATRWTLLGTHTGPGWYGPPTGKRVRLMGITHSEIGQGRVVKEWLMYDEVALLKQLVTL